MERNARLLTKALLLIFAIVAVLNSQTDCCNWANFGVVPVRPITAAWMLLSIVITGIREFRRGPRPISLAILEFGLCVAGILGVVNSLSLYYYGYQNVPSAGTMLGFLVFWAVHLLLMIERVRYLRALYLMVVIVGAIGLVGHIANIPSLRYEFDGISNAISLPAAIYLILLGWAAYSREKQGA